jgi:hypothetical protein
MKLPLATVCQPLRAGTDAATSSWRGCPPQASWIGSGALPAKVVVYRRPLLAAFPDPDELERQIRITVLHEVAHYFGIDEDRIDELGYG